MRETLPTHRWSRGSYTVLTDPNAIDFEATYQFLSTAPWATGMSHEVMQRALRNSLCFSLFEEDRQIGLARVISDLATYAYLCDVYVVASHRRRGLGSWLLRCVLAHPEIGALKRIALVTHDAQHFYRRLGFEPARPGLYMERLRAAAIDSHKCRTTVDMFQKE